MVAALGGPADFVANSEKHLPAAPVDPSGSCGALGHRAEHRHARCRRCGRCARRRPHASAGSDRSRRRPHGSRRRRRHGRCLASARHRACAQRRRRRRRRRAPCANAYRIGDAPAASAPSVLERIGGQSMSLLVAVTWETQPWVERFRRHLPDRDIVVLGEDFDRSAIRYVATWGPKPGSLSGLPNLEAIFSLGAGVDHLMSYPDLPDVPIVRVAQDDLTHRMSEYMVLHCLMHLRDQRRFDEDQKAKRWRARPCAAHRRRCAHRHHGLRRAGSGFRPQAENDGLRRRRLEPHAEIRRRIRGLCGGGRPDAVPQPHRHPHRSHAAHAGHARNPQPLPVPETRAGRQRSAGRS